MFVCVRAKESNFDATSNVTISQFPWFEDSYVLKWICCLRTQIRLIGCNESKSLTCDELMTRIRNFIEQSAPYPVMYNSFSVSYLFGLYFAHQHNDFEPFHNSWLNHVLTPSILVHNYYQLYLSHKVVVSISISILACSIIHQFDDK